MTTIQRTTHACYTTRETATMLGMTYRPALAISTVLCTGCPADIINNYYGETDTGDGSETTGSPDLPAETETDTGTSETGDGDGDPGDGDGDPGDGDGDADLGALIVLADGVRIGYLMDVWDYGYVVWDDDHELLFKVNAETGNVAREVYEEPGLFQYAVTPDCTGPRYIKVEYATAQDCDVPAPMLRPVIAVDGSLSGHIAAASLETTVGDSVVIVPQSLLHPSGACYPTDTLTCAFSVEETDAIPVTFPLPITVSEVIAP